MADITRISVSLESALLELFDRFLAGRNYATRSEAIRDLIRDKLIHEEVEGAKGERVAVVMLVYDHHARELASRLLDKQHHHHQLVVATMHVHLGERHCLEITVLRGPAGKVRQLGNEMVATKGVLNGEVIVTGGEGTMSHLH